MPDNKQIDETLLYVKNTSPVEIEKLSPDGRKLIQDARDIVETARLMVQEKNADELFQNLCGTRGTWMSLRRRRIRMRSYPLIRVRHDGRTGEIFLVGVRRMLIAFL
jgi:exopolyphosphatase/pppGpp-phosphohydrolase